MGGPSLGCVSRSAGACLGFGFLSRRAFVASIKIFGSTCPGDDQDSYADPLRDRSLKHPELLLAEAKRLAWLFNWPKARPL